MLAALPSSSTSSRLSTHAQASVSSRCQQLAAAAAAAARHAPVWSRGVQARAVLRTAEEEQDSTAEREREVRQEVTRRIKALGQQRKFKEAVQQLASLATLGIQPDTQAATALLAACTRSRDMKAAQSVFDALFADFLQPDEVTFAVMLRGYGSQNPPSWQSIDSVLTSMKSTYGIEPSATSYNALLEICYKSNDSDRALDVIDRMANDGVEPDDFTWELAARKRTWRSYMRKVMG